MRRTLLVVGIALLTVAIPSALGSHTTDPSSVTVAGSLQQELGCSGDWQPECALTRLAYDAADDVWQAAFSVPAGGWEYKAALNGGWDENYGAGAAQNGPNIPLALGAQTSVKFYYDHESHWITDDVTSVIATVPGSYQSEIGCPGDWQPDCLRSWLQDPDGDAVYEFTAEVPAGSYEAKVALDESWDVNYGAGGAQNGPNIPFTVPIESPVRFAYDAATHVLSITVLSTAPTGDVDWDGVRHDSRDALYRTPGGAVAAGTPVKLRLRTFHDDVTRVRARVWDVNLNGPRVLEMRRAAADVSCYQPGLGSRTCDFWEVTLANAAANNLWYRFVVTDGPDTDYYADDTQALDGGLGRVTDDEVDWSYALTVHEPGFTAPGWARDGILYQIFPDRFHNADARNDPQTGDVRYDDPVLALPWSTLPEGHCRRYADAESSCPWRFDDTPPAWSPTIEGPRGRDYFGGDLKGVRQKLDYLRSLGVTAIYFNPIFAARSNHRYDTADYDAIDPALGDIAEFRKLVKQARERGIRIVLDGVYNHMSSDSARFDRYGHYAETGACESLSSPFRSWFVFRNDNVPCAGADYEGWFGFDSIPVLRKTNPEVQSYFLTGANAVVERWLREGAAGWRFDVSGDPSFPAGYWEAARAAAKAADPGSLLISETWGKDTTLLRILRGDRLDTTMNYRLRDAVVGLLTPGSFDAKGFPDSGRRLKPSEAASRLASIREDYPDAAYYSLMNLLDSHDTERLLWTLTPGSETRAEKEHDPANLAAGKQRLRLASLIQYAVPGMPTVYYGDEVGVTGDDDPDDRRTFPWPSTGGKQDAALLGWYRRLGQLRHSSSALRRGSFEVVAADDACGTLALGRKAPAQAAVVAVNAGTTECAVPLPHGGVLAVSTGSAQLEGTELRLGPGAGALVLADGDFDPPAAPTGLGATAGSGEVSLAWSAVPGAAGYNAYRSPLSGGGYVKVNGAPLAGTSLTDTGVENGRRHHYVVRALDAAGNESGPSDEVSALPRLPIGWANTQWPPATTHTISAVDRTDTVYGQVWIDGETQKPGPTATLRAELGFGQAGSAVSTWVWQEAAFNVDAGNNDEFMATLLPEATGTYWYAYRYTTSDGDAWVYADLGGPFTGETPPNPGVLTVAASGDTAAPATPTGLRVVSASPAGIELTWDAVAGDATLYGYELLRDGEQIARVTGTGYADTDVVEGETYAYAVRAVDLSFNRSDASAPVSATAERRLVTVTFTAIVPGTTDGTGRTVHIAGTLDRLDPPGPEWNPGGVSLTRLDETRWSVTLTGLEGTQLEYKYALGSWDYVEKGAACDEIANRQLTIAYGSDGTHAVADTVANWRNVSPCGN